MPTPRSKGCLTCRKRRIACSRERPACSNCVNSGRQCQGYNREAIFVHLNPREDDEQKVHFEKKRLGDRFGSFKDASAAESSAATAAGPSRRVEVEEVENDGTLIYNEEYSSSSSDGSSTDVRRSANKYPIYQTQTIAAAAHRHLVLGAFLGQYHVFTANRSFRATHHWLATVPDRPQCSKALEVGVTAFCTAKLARQTHDTVLAQESLRLYGQGLRELQKALYHPRKMYADDTVAACTLMAMFEAFECPSRGFDGYQNHVDGCSRLFEIRGPEAHREGLGHAVFASFRIMGAALALFSKSTFLEQEQWKTVPWSTQPKTSFDEIVDLMLEAPAIMKQGDTVTKLTSVRDQYSSAWSILVQCLALDIRLKDFRINLMQSYPHALYWSRIAPDDHDFSGGYDDGTLDPSDEHMRQIDLQFGNIRIAGSLNFYWALLTMLHSGLCDLRSLLTQLRDLLLATDIGAPHFLSTFAYAPNITPYDLSGLDFALGFAQTATNVQNSVDYCLNDQCPDLGLGAITAPLKICLDTLRPSGRFEAQCREIEAALEEVRKRGMGLIEFFDT